MLICPFIFLQPRQNLLSAANQIGEASQDILKQVGGDVDADSKEFEVCSIDYRNKCVMCRTFSVVILYTGPLAGAGEGGG